jgi:hypothetical protein
MTISFLKIGDGKDPFDLNCIKNILYILDCMYMYMRIHFSKLMPLITYTCNDNSLR